MTFYCCMCGNQFNSRAGNAKYCPKCRQCVKHKGKPYIPSAKLRPRPKPARQQLSISQVCRLAREAGLSYGQYVARLEGVEGNSDQKRMAKPGMEN